MTPPTFAELLTGYRRRAGVSRRGLARRAACDRQYLLRLEGGSRLCPSRPIVEGLCRALALPPLEANGLLLAAGLAPAALRDPAQWDDLIQAICDVLTDFRRPAAERAAFRAVICTLAAQWAPARP